MKITAAGAIILIGGFRYSWPCFATAVQTDEKETSQANEQSNQPNLPVQ